MLLKSPGHTGKLGYVQNFKQPILLTSLESFAPLMASHPVLPQHILCTSFFLIPNRWIYKSGRKVHSENKLYSERKRRNIKTAERSIQEK